MYQATPELNVHVMTTLATFKIANSSTGFFGADFVPLALGGLFAVNKNIDVQAEFLMDDLVDAGSTPLRSRSVGATTSTDPVVAAAVSSRSTTVVGLFCGEAASFGRAPESFALKKTPGPLTCAEALGRLTPPAQIGRLIRSPHSGVAQG